MLAEILALPGLPWLLLAVIAAGLVRGFSGFGSAMIIMPAASAVLPPVQAILFLVTIELIGPLPNLRAALREGAPRDVALLVSPVLITLPIGLWFLTLMEPVTFGYVISIVVLILLALVMSGWRFQGALTRPMTLVAGALGGFMTGFSGIPGPPVIMLYMASQLPIAVIRANFLLYLLAIDLLLFPILWLSGQLEGRTLLLGLMIALPYLAANRLGAMLFNPDAARLFRFVAYTVIATSAILGLPLWRG